MIIPKRYEKGKDAVLLLKLQQHDNSVFEEIYDYYAERLFYYIYSKIGNKEQSEDILQEVFIQFWNKKEQVQQSIYGFLFHITKCAILNHFRSTRVKNEYIVHLSNYMHEINTITPQKYLEAKEIMEQIETLVAKLPPQCRKVFAMSRFEHKSNDEIALELSLSKRTVENYITKALAFIREHNVSIFLIIAMLFSEEK